MAVYSLVVLVICCFTAIQGRPSVDVRITGPGRSEATPGEFPYLVVILDKSTRALITSGVLIRSNVVLTLAYNYYIQRNYDPSEIVAVLGTFNRSLDEPTRQEIDVTDIVINPEFLATSEGMQTGDLSLIKLAENAVVGEAVKVLSLKDINSNAKNDNKLAKNGDCVTAGYGLIKWNEYETIYPRTMMKHNPEMQTSKNCEKYVEQFGVEYPKKRWLCSKNDDLTESRHGDGGNPLMCELNGGDPMLYGLVSGGGTTYDPTGFTVFSRISTYRTWIVDTAKELSKVE